ncbi:MAG: dethiobiotin synthase [Bdellovibrionales bacterium]|nr:dethiobiotin synthase [Bdellovibrionales bacterium]
MMVTGTDTGVGKTVVSALLCLLTKRRYWKPIQSGTEPSTDSDWISNLLGRDRVLPETYRLRNPVSPHLSAKIDNVEIKLDSILDTLSNISDSLIIEGAGGLLVPLNRKEFIIDLISKIPCRCILVARSGLGTINHTLMSLEALAARNIQPLGVVMVGERNPENKCAIEKYGNIQVLGEVPLLSNFERHTLLSHSQNIFKHEDRTWISLQR